MSARPPLRPILIAEDDPDDLTLLTQHLQDAGVKLPVVTFKHGGELIDFLKPMTAGETNVRPALILLDINMPKVDGLEALQWIRQQPALQEITVVILSGAVEP